MHFAKWAKMLVRFINVTKEFFREIENDNKICIYTGGTEF
jgi:hypothetical protein